MEVRVEVWMHCCIITQASGPGSYQSAGPSIYACTHSTSTKPIAAAPPSDSSAVEATRSSPLSSKLELVDIELMLRCTSSCRRTLKWLVTVLSRRFACSGTPWMAASITVIHSRIAKGVAKWKGQNNLIAPLYVQMCYRPHNEMIQIRCCFLLMLHNNYVHNR